ncbi:deaminase [Hymenobacter humi]|uniref:Deaminase n=1 Tax=Hymenobacter humi TaxID=1411620 RepID=A0ABW2UD90_9BACT
MSDPHRPGSNYHDRRLFHAPSLAEAEKALSAEEIPIGAVVVFEKQIIGRGYNQTEQAARRNGPRRDAGPDGRRQPPG